MDAARWEHFAHEADMGVRGFGDSKAEAFEQTAVALTAVITDPEMVHATQVVDVNCEAPDDELLLVDWLNAVIFETSTRNLLFSRFEVHLDDGKLRGKAWGEQVDVPRHQPAVEVKGATYTALRVAKDENGRWMAQCVIDV